MLWLEITLVALVILFLLFVIGSSIYRKKKGLPTGECRYCHPRKKGLLEEYRDKYGNH